MLSVPPDATQKEIQRAYRKLAKILHPDISARPDAEEDFKILNEAYQVLSDPKRRIEYDSRLQVHSTDPSEHMSYAGYKGTKYQNPSTWYDPYVSRDPEPQPDEDIYYNPPHEAKKQAKSILRKILRLLFFASLIMLLVILMQLLVLPTSHNFTTQKAAALFNEGNMWMNEWEYQKAIDSYTEAVSLRPDFADAWREKGYAELLKGVEIEERRPVLSTNPEKLYRSAVASLRMAVKYDADAGIYDLVTIKNLGNAYERLLMWQEVENLYRKAQELAPPDPEIDKRLHLVNLYVLDFSKQPPPPPDVSLRLRAIQYDTA